MDVDTAPVGIAVNRDGTRAYTANGGGRSFSVIDTATNSVTATVPLLASEPTGVAINGAGTLIYVGDGNNDKVVVIDTATKAVIAQVTVGSFPTGVAIGNGSSKPRDLNVDGKSDLIWQNTSTGQRVIWIEF